MSTIKKYLSLVKFSHTIFAMPFALIGFVLGVSSLRQESAAGLVVGSGSIVNSLWFKFLLVILCMILARSAAMSFNRYLDRHFDAMNPRTAIREIPAGILKADAVLWFTIACSLLFILCTFFINRICFFLSPVALLVILGYSYTKRFTALCHIVLGIGLSLAPIGAYLAVVGHFDWLPILFSLTVITWVSGFDIIYALQDADFDRSNQLYSIPASIGKAKALRVSEILHGISALMVLIAGFYGGFHWLYWIGAAVFVGMLVYQHSIVKPEDLRKVNLAFMTANGIASVIFSVFVIAAIFLRNSILV